MGISMSILTRVLILTVLVIAAIASYSYGISSGVFIFIISGFVLEMAFWFGVFPKKKKSS